MQYIPRSGIASPFQIIEAAQEGQSYFAYASKRA